MLDAVLHHAPALLIVIIAIGLFFDYTNGFHDTANAVATSIATRVVPPMVAVIACAILNFCGALVSQKVAGTVAKGLVQGHAATQEVILAALVGAIVWNLITWYFGIPNSSSHALIGGLVGAAIVHAGLSAVIWSGVGLKVVFPMVAGPLLGGVGAWLIMTLLNRLVADKSPHQVGSWFTQLQRVSAAGVAFNHGMNDAQKTMGVITLALVAYHIPGVGGAKVQIPTWVVLSCATAMGLGTASGGWRIIKTLGTRITRLEPVHGFAAETSASLVLFGASQLGMPVSTTHIVSGSVFGVGIAKRQNAVRWGYAQRMVAAWVLTLPAAAIIAGLSLLVIALAPHAGHSGASVAALAHR